MATKTYQQLLIELAEEQGPDEYTLATLRKTALEQLEQLKTDLARFVLPEERLVELLTAFFTEVYGEYGIFIMSGDPRPGTITLAKSVVGNGPGSWLVTITWTAKGTGIYIMETETGILREAGTVA